MSDDGRDATRRWTTRLVDPRALAWLVAFFLLPFLIVLKISLSQTAIAQPPYVPVFDLAAGWEGLQGILRRRSRSTAMRASSPTRCTAWSYCKSLQVATISTAILLLIGYPVAYALARAPRRLQGVLVLLVVLPFWTSFLIRVYAWINILQHDGLLNQALLALRIIDAPVSWLATDTRSISASSIRIFRSWCCRSTRRWRRWTRRCSKPPPISAARRGARSAVTVPLSLPGIVAGSLLCFIPIIGEFVIPDLLGSSRPR